LQNDASKKVEEAAAAVETPVSTECYKAIYEQDTPKKINTLNKGKITGDLEMKTKICQQN
jgi:hypothetical protein